VLVKGPAVPEDQRASPTQFVPEVVDVYRIVCAVAEEASRTARASATGTIDVRALAVGTRERRD
jgi:hypothetical protein